MQVKIGVNRLWPGEKLPPKDPRWGRYTRSFHSETLDVTSFMELISEGFAFCPPMKDSHRIKTNFIEAWHLVLDFDNGDETSSLDTLEADPFIAQYASFLYSTPSSTPEAPKSRVVFILDQPITDLATADAIMKALVRKFPHSDQAVGEASRFLYGSHPTTGTQVFLGNVIPMAVAASLMVVAQPQHAAPSKPMNGNWPADKQYRVTEIIKEYAPREMHVNSNPQSKWSLRCPLCTTYVEDETDSFTIADDDNLWKCFACDRSGNAITLLKDFGWAPERKSNGYIPEDPGETDYTPGRNGHQRDDAYAGTVTDDQLHKPAFESAAENEIPELPDEVWPPGSWLTRFKDWVLPTTDGAVEGMFAIGSVILGAAIGREIGVYYFYPTYANFFVTICGQTGVPRKTTIIKRGKAVLERAFTGGFLAVQDSIGSGEGLLENFTEEIEDPQSVGKIKKTILRAIPGKRVLLNENELTNLLKKAHRPGTLNLTDIMLGLFDGEDFTPKTRKRSMEVVDPFFSIVSATTPDALETVLSDEDIGTGLIPRFCFFRATPRKPMASGPMPDENVLAALANELQAINKFCRELKQNQPYLSPNDDAKQLWADYFEDITLETRAAPTYIGAIMERVPVMIHKWALIYAIMNRSNEIDGEAMSRALCVGDYLMKVAKLTPSHVAQAPIARIESKILQAMEETPGLWWTASTIHRKVGGRVQSEVLKRALEALTEMGRLIKKSATRGGWAYRINSQS